MLKLSTTACKKVVCGRLIQKLRINSSNRVGLSTLSRCFSGFLLSVSHLTFLHLNLYRGHLIQKLQFKYN